MIIFTDGGKFPTTKEMIGFPQVTKILSKFSLRTKIKVNISTELYRFPPIRQDSLTGRKSCESKGGVVSPSISCNLMFTEQWHEKDLFN